MEKLSNIEIEKIIKELKENGKYKEYQEMIHDDYEEHQVVYKLDSDEIIALAYKNNTIPFKMQEYWIHCFSLVKKSIAPFLFKKKSFLIYHDLKLLYFLLKER